MLMYKLVIINILKMVRFLCKIACPSNQLIYKLLDRSKMKSQPPVLLLATLAPRSFKKDIKSPLQSSSPTPSLSSHQFPQTKEKGKINVKDKLESIVCDHLASLLGP
jgi:hypothetical protein